MNWPIEEVIVVNDKIAVSFGVNGHKTPLELSELGLKIDKSKITPLDRKYLIRISANPRVFYKGETYRTAISNLKKLHNLLVTNFKDYSYLPANFGCISGSFLFKSYKKWCYLGSFSDELFMFTTDTPESQETIIQKIQETYTMFLLGN
jgi:hypothetical protein